jgi:hypothetical protein
LRNPRLKHFDGTLGAGLVFVKLSNLDLNALKKCSGDSFFFAQLRQSLFGLGALAGGRSRHPFGLGRCAGALGKVGFGGYARVFGFAPFEIKQQAFGMAQLPADLTVTLGLTGLARERCQLVGELFDDVVNAGKVCFGAFKL